MITWPDTLELMLDGIAQGGEAVGRWEGRVVFAGGGLPGERVSVRLGERHESYARGEVVAVTEASPDRVPPRLPGADSMPWQHIAYPAQLRFKQQILADQLAKIGGLTDIVVEETIPAARAWAYRTSARFHSDGERIGYYAADSHTIQPIEADPLLLPVLNEALAVFRAVLREGIRFESPAPLEIILRASELGGYALGVLRGPGALEGLALRWRNRCPALAGVSLLPASGPPVQLGAEHLIEELGGVAFQLHPATFFQVNTAAAEELLRLVRAGLVLRGSERLLDLYCGAGTFALPLAGQVGEVVGVEEHAGAIADARASAELNGIANARFLAKRVEVVLPQLDPPFDAAVLDPPRRGCHPQAVGALVRLAPAGLVYVSCHPATLARDLKRLVEGGYRVISARPVDLFPQTPHVESVCVLERD